MNKLNILFAITLASISNSVFAVTGIIDFVGAITNATCTAKVNGAGTGDGSVLLPTVIDTALPALESYAGTTAFTITLETAAGADCVDAGLNASPYFEFEGDKVQPNGNLKNTNATTSAGVDVQLLNDVGAVINTTEASGQAVSTANNRIFTYYARYVAKGTVVPGAVESSVSYSIIYK